MGSRIARARVLVADCPWSFSDSLPGPGRGASKHYGCMSIADLALFDLPPLADDAWLFFWRVGSMQREALAVIRAWDFKDPTSEMVWVKTKNNGDGLRMGMGRSVRNCHEVALVCKRGRPERSAANVPSVIFAPRGVHSAKPDAFYEAVERFSAGPYVELFARRVRAGWMQYGDQLPNASATAHAEELR